MAILSDLVKTIATVEGIESATVGLIARHIREAGFIATGGRGPSAATMGIADAANLLIATNATRTTSEAAKAVEVYRNLEAYEFRASFDPRPLSNWGNLGDAVEQLIQAVSLGRLEEPFIDPSQDLDFQDAFARGEVRIELRFRTSNPSATIKIWNISYVVDDAMQDQWVHTVPPFLSLLFTPPERRPRSDHRNKPSGDRIDETTIGYRTLHAVGRLITLKE